MLCNSLFLFSKEKRKFIGAEAPILYKFALQICRTLAKKKREKRLIKQSLKKRKERRVC